MRASELLGIVTKQLPTACASGLLIFTYKEEAPVTCVCVLRSGHPAEQRCPEHAKRANSVASGRRSTEHAKRANRVASGSSHRSTEHAKRANRVATTTC